MNFEGDKQEERSYLTVKPIVTGSNLLQTRAAIQVYRNSLKQALFR